MNNHLSGYTITNTGSSPDRQGGRYPAAVRVYHWGKLVCEVFPPSYQPLKYCKEHPKSKYTRQLIGQMVAYGMGEHTIAALLAAPSEK